MPITHRIMDPARERENTLATLQAAIERLHGSMSFDLIPKEGMAFGYAMRGARDCSGVAGVEGGIKQAKMTLWTAGPCRFSNDDTASRAILTAMKFDPDMRSAVVMQYSDCILDVLENDLMLECASYAGVCGNGGVSTMDWGIAFCCREGVPDVVYEKKPDMKDSRLVLFGEDPSDVANNIIICSNRL